jgi:hypothetical protein
MNVLRVSLISDTFFCNRAAQRLRERLLEAKSQGGNLVILPEIPLNPWSPATKTAREEDAEGHGGIRFEMMSKLAAEVHVKI